MKRKTHNKRKDHDPARASLAMGTARGSDTLSGSYI